MLNQTFKDIEKRKIQSEYLNDNERKILEKRSQILRLYLIEHVIPYLSEGILNICQEMPDNPVEVLADFLDKKAEEIEEIERIKKSEANNS